MKRTLTTTTSRAINYGAILQTYSLHRKIKDMGCQNEVVHVKNEKPKYFEEIKGYSIRAKLIKSLENCFKIIRYKKCKRAFDNFLKFSKENIISTPEIMTLNEIDLDNYNLIITGSDQVFGFGTKQNVNDIRFLKIDNVKAIKRYSYAASFGSYNLNNEEKIYMKEQLKKYITISVREEQGKSFLKKEFNLDSQVNIDPVFLHTKKEWSSLTTPSKLIKEKYILVYFLVGAPILQKVIDKVKEKYKLPVVCLQLTAIKRIKADKYIFDAGPKEFLNLFKNAEFVITTSFHGTAFSVIFEKPFYSVLKNGYRTERFENLLKQLHLENRMITDCLGEIESIDYKNISPIIEQKRIESIEYLKKILDV